MSEERDVGTSAWADSGWGWLLSNGVHLAVLWAFAVVRPAFDLLSQGPDLFVGRKVAGVEFLVVVLLFAFLPPALLLGLEAIANLHSRRYRNAAHLLFAWGLLSLLSLYFLKLAFPGLDLGLLVGAVALGLLLTVAYKRFQAMSSVLDVLAPAPILFVVLFLFFSPSKGLIFQSEPTRPANDADLDAPVIWVMFDELPVSSLMMSNAELDAQRFPNFGRLSADATWFRNVAASADQTDEAIPVALDGQRPEPGQIPTFTDHPNTAFTLLSGSHTVSASEHATWLCPSSVCDPEFTTSRRMYDLASAMSLLYVHTVAPPEYEERLAAVGSTWGEARASEVPNVGIDPSETSSAELAGHGRRQFEGFLSSIEPEVKGDRPPFHFLHSSLPHIPWNHLPSGKAYESVKDEPLGLSGSSLSTWTSDRGLVEQGFQRHLLQTAFVDRLLGRLLSRLKRLGLYDRAAIVVTADHGVSFHPGGERRTVEHDNVGDVALVPFFVKAPGQTRPRIVDRPIQTVDVLPTVAEILGVSIPWNTDGISAFKMTRAGRVEVKTFRHEDEAQKQFPAGLLLKQREATIRRQAQLFGTGAIAPDFYGFGKFNELVGSKEAELQSGRSDLSVTISNHDEFRTVDPESGYVPALITGEVTGAGGEAVRDLAIAVNGRIAAVVPTYQEDGTRFSAMIPEQRLQSGPNTIAVYEISERHGQRRLDLLRR